jgi:hypothetical protein
MPLIKTDKFKLVTLYNIANKTPQRIIGLDIGTLKTGYSIADPDFSESMFYKPNSCTPFNNNPSLHN